MTAPRRACSRRIESRLSTIASCFHPQGIHIYPEIAQLGAASRSAACKAVSSALRNRDLSLLICGAGPREMAPISRRCCAISRPASALPIFASVHCFPIGETTRAPFLRQRDASGISEVTHTSAAPMRAAIQSSAASAVSPTRTMLTFDIPAGRIGREPLETTNTLTLKACRHAVDLLSHRARITIDVNVSLPTSSNVPR